MDSGEQRGDLLYDRGAFRLLRWGRAAPKGSLLYLYVFDWPKSGVLRLQLKNKVTASYLLADPKKPIPVTVEGERISLKLPAAAPIPSPALSHCASKANRPQSQFHRSAGPAERHRFLAQDLVLRRPSTEIMKPIGTPPHQAGTPAG